MDEISCVYMRYRRGARTKACSTPSSEVAYFDRHSSVSGVLVYEFGEIWGRPMFMSFLFD